MQRCVALSLDGDAFCPVLEHLDLIPSIERAAMPPWSCGAVGGAAWTADGGLRLGAVNSGSPWLCGQGLLVRSIATAGTVGFLVGNSPQVRRCLVLVVLLLRAWGANRYCCPGVGCPMRSMPIPEQPRGLFTAL